MHRKLFLGFAALLTFTACDTDNDADVAKGPSIEERVRKERLAHNRMVYDRALENEDYQTAVNALYHIMVDDTTKQQPYLDSLVAHYKELRLTRPALKASQKLQAFEPNNTDADELLVQDLLNKGKVEEAKMLLRKLYGNTQDPKYLFTVLQMQMQLGQAKGIDSSMDMIEAHIKKNPKDSIEMENQMNPGQMQNVPTSVALNYAQGLIAANKGDFPTAKKELRQAIKDYPEFSQARQLLDEINRMAGGR